MIGGWKTTTCHRYFSLRLQTKYEKVFRYSNYDHDDVDSDVLVNWLFTSKMTTHVLNDLNHEILSASKRKWVRRGLTAIPLYFSLLFPSTSYLGARLGLPRDGFVPIWGASLVKFYRDSLRSWVEEAQILDQDVRPRSVSVRCRFYAYASTRVEALEGIRYSNNDHTVSNTVRDMYL